MKLNKDELIQAIKTANVPTLPEVAQKLVALCKDENANFADFARVLENDPGLASRIMRVANSAFYGLRNQASTLERAITAIGLKHVKSISLGFHLANALNDFHGDGFNMERFWEECVLRGVIARQIAGKYCPNRREEAFLIGLLQNCGIPVLVEVFGKDYAKIWDSMDCSQAALNEIEREVYDFDHQQAAQIIAQQWELPEILAAPLASHHCRSLGKPSADDKTQLKQIAYFVGNLSLHGAGSLSEEDLTFTQWCQSVFNMDTQQLQNILEESKDEFNGIAKLFTEVLPENLNVAGLLAQANSLLSHIAEDDQPKNVMDLEAKVRELQDKCAALSQSVNKYQQKATTDSLTGLCTRDVLVQYIQKTIEQTNVKKSSIMVMFIDVDDFKSVNDNYGHKAGDFFLKALAALMKKFFGKKGCLCRQGGDEMVVALANINYKQAIHIAEVFQKKTKLIKQKVNCDQDKPLVVNLSCSVGMIHCSPGSQPESIDTILELADQQMYIAKRNGKGRLSHQAIANQTAATN
ncbi:MAG: GGDEF domain-containing protein [Sedimentisphaerales bacterium]|nr:GGDEF domain-containing protein [Sedimentisphaerales bacterium]